jgi:enoyl-CoA hydratase/carnithine racemase
MSDVPARPVVVEQSGSVLHVRLNRPEKLNALDVPALTELRRIIDEEATNPNVRVAVLTGTGRAFCAGVDLDMTSDVLDDRTHMGAVVARMHGLVAALEQSPIPWIGAINGLACAGGLELLLGCDIAVAASTARLADYHARFGLFPGGGASQRLPRLIGQRRASWMLLTGEWVDAGVARAWGLVTEVVDDAELHARCAAIANLLAARSPLLASVIKQTLLNGEAKRTDSALADERDLFLDYMSSADARIGLDAFATRSVPAFPPRTEGASTPGRRLP